MGDTFVVAEIIGPDILIVLAIVILLFGGAKIPKLARSLGQASHEFRKGVGEGAVDDAAPAKPAVPPPAAEAPTNGVTPPAAEAPAGAPTSSNPRES
jgi:sec-independent protein translocase protein TatA